MKKINTVLISILFLFTLLFTGCQGKDVEPTIDDTTVFEEDLQYLDDSELADLESDPSMDTEMMTIDETEQDALEDEDTTSTEEEKEADEQETDSGSVKVKETGTYTSKEEVAVYVHTYGKLPSNYITKTEAKKLGWVSKEGNLDDVAPGKSIGGDRFGNYDKMLPIESGRKYYECDIDYDGGYRAEKRLIYSNDGLVFYTEDHYKTFEQLY